MKGKINLLDVIPVRMAHVSTENEEGLCVLAFPRFKRQWMRKFFLPKGMSPDIRVRLEENGTAVWELIDGKRTVNDIVSELNDRFPGEENYGTRITTFITQLHKDKFIEYRIVNR